MHLEHSIPLTGVTNARELGGYTTADGRTVRHNVLLRTAKLCDLTEQDSRILTDDFRVQHIVDFRMAMEIKGFDDPPVGDAVYHWIKILDVFLPEGVESPDFAGLTAEQVVIMSEQFGMLEEDMYIGFLEGECGRRGYAEFFRILLEADPDRAVLWHCTSGKDRTGLAAMLLLSVFGVDEQTILDDYLLTNRFNANRIAGIKYALAQKGYDEAFTAKAAIVFEAVDGRFMQNALDYLKSRYGSPVGYIRDALHITDAELESLRAKYLE
jgi:protein-tyrosine phosphatase